MNIVSKNQPCPCGSGKKYKMCCMSKEQSTHEIQPKRKGTFGWWEQSAYDLLGTNKENKVIIDTLFAVLDFIEKKKWEGACHAVSAITHVLLNEQQIDSKPCLGIVEYKGKYFDHSWIEMNGCVYDIAIYKPLDNKMSSEPIFRDFNLETKKKTSLHYGSDQNIPYDMNALMLKSTSFCDYMDNAPFKNGLWGFVETIAKELNLTIDINGIKSNYQNTIWHEKTTAN